MPPQPVPELRPVYLVAIGDEHKLCHIINRAEGQCLVHYLDENAQLNDTWIPEQDCRLYEHQHPAVDMSRKRKRGGKGGGSKKASTSPPPYTSPLVGGMVPLPTTDPSEVATADGESDEQHTQKEAPKRNYEDVYFGNWKIKTWYPSPYPLDDFELEEASSSSSLSNAYNNISIARPRGHARGRASDLFSALLTRPPGTPLRNLWVCDKCLKYFAEGVTYDLHTRQCTVKHPPGNLVYKRGVHTIREIDGALEKLYCQNLSLFGKLFIDVKTLYFDTDNFLFYVLTDETSSGEELIGFFSKEKISFDDYNLACIVTLPHRQRQAFGMLMIEFSYELSRRAGKVGSPERPLSDLGLRGYLAYWVATIVRFLRHVLAVLPPSANDLIMRTQGQLPNVLNPKAQVIADLAIENPNLKKKRRTMPPTDVPETPFDHLDETFTKLREFQFQLAPDGSMKVDVLVRCTIADIARGCNLTLADTTFAMNECGLLSKRLSEGGEREMVVITREIVERVAKERNVKMMMCMDLRYLCIDCPPKEDRIQKSSSR